METKLLLQAPDCGRKINSTKSKNLQVFVMAAVSWDARVLRFLVIALKYSIYA